MKKISIFTNESDKNVEITKEDKKEYTVMDKQLMTYIIKEFPEVSNKISSALDNLKKTLELSIDIIEDKSSLVIKESRDFILSSKYRENSMLLHDISRSINDYIDWMRNENNRYVENAKNKVMEDDKEEDSEAITLDEGDYIFEDFTMKEPKAFILEKKLVQVDDWEDMVVKTADVLIKYYKNNTIDESFINVTPVQKKSKQNDYRDTIIEMLEEYNVNLQKYKVVRK